MLTVLNHALVHHWMAELRSVDTDTQQFRRLVRRLSAALFHEASGDLPVAPVPVRTPLAAMTGHRLARAPLLVPVLRAGLGMAEGILEVLPEALTGHLGLYRDHETLLPVSYYTPSVDAEERCVFVLDPMLATGGSACAALDLVKSWGAAQVRLLGIVGAPPGVERVRTAHPDVPVYLCALDEGLNEIGYIVPGLGDAGDRQFGTR